MFHDGDLQSGIATAVQQSKAVLCFVHGKYHESDASRDWEKTLTEDGDLRRKIIQHAVSLRLQDGSQEVGFLSSFTPLSDIPSVIVIKNGSVQLHAHAGQPGGGRVKDRLLLLFRSTATNTPLVNTINAATPDAPSSPIPSSFGNAQNVPALAPNALSPARNPPSRAPSDASNIASNVPGEVAVPIAPLDTIPEQPPSSQQIQRIDYIKMQKEREQQAKDERERIKQQIKVDREERRRLDEMRKQHDSISQRGAQSSTAAKPRSSQIRVQVRTFDGSTFRQSLEPSSTIARNVRPWIDETSQQSTPYNLKLILTPMPNRNIEAGEEEQSLLDLGIKGSCTLVMVPVQGYVESYAGSAPAHLVNSAVSGGYNLLSGTAGALLGSLRSVLGYGQPDQDAAPTSSTTTSTVPDAANIPASQVRVRSLADQRAESSKRDQQFYNGNSTNFQPRKDESKED